MKTESGLYTVTLIDRDGNPHEIKAFGLDELNGKVQQIDVLGVKCMFSPPTQQHWKEIASRPVGEVELLIGSDNLGLHPAELEAQGNLRVFLSRFGSCYCWQRSST